jgi:exoribonuclease-2
LSETAIKQASLVLYKTRPARVVKHTGDKLEIELKGGKTVKVRAKDVQLLHPGPIQSLSELVPPEGEVETAWELLAGETTNLIDLADLIYGIFSPATAWATWQYTADGLYFSGTPDQIVAHSAEEVARERMTRESKAAEERAWSEFLERVHTGQIIEEDGRYLREVEELALGRQQKSRVLRELKRTQTPENAHALLLELGYWDHTQNPYPQRLKLVTAPSGLSLPSLPDEDRLDLTHLPAFAIDDEESRDPDDALSLEEDRLWVHIADVAALVQPDSPVDLETRARGANLYLPEGTTPMLPPQATHKLGLGLAEVSPALSFGLKLDSDGQAADLEIVPSWIKVNRLTYEEAEARLEEEPFSRLYRLAQQTKERREKNGAVSIDLPEVKVRLVDGRIQIRPILPLKSRDLVREAMLLCGETLARFALTNEIPFLFTSQGSPAESELLEGLAGMFALRRSMKRSQITGVPGPHAGLGLEIYTQATSPLRRYPDLVAHQQLRAYLRGESLLGASEILERIGEAEAISSSVRQAGRLSYKHWTLVYLLEQPNWRGEGVVVDRYGSRGTILIPELDLEVRMHLRKNLPLNSKVNLTLNEVNLPELEAYFLVKP